MIGGVGGFDSADFGDRSFKERSFGTGEDSFGKGEDGFAMGDGDPESNLEEPFLVVLVTLGVGGVALPFEASEELDLDLACNIVDRGDGGEAGECHQREQPSSKDRVGQRATADRSTEEWDGSDMERLNCSHYYVMLESREPEKI